MHDIPPPDFTGLDPTRLVTIYRRHLPHWRQEGATYFVTFRLADSLPKQKLDELRDECERWDRLHPDPSEEEITDQARAHMKRVEAWLDQGFGSCVLRNPQVAKIVEDRVRYLNGEQYALFSFVITPNPVHALVKPCEGFELDDGTQAWKGVSAKLINKRINRDGTLWQDESFDRIVRDTAHLRKTVRYIEANPDKAGIQAPYWTTPAWDGWLGR